MYCIHVKGYDSEKEFEFCYDSFDDFLLVLAAFPSVNIIRYSVKRDKV